MSSVESLQVGKSNSRPNLVKYIIARLNFIESRKVVIMWIPSHVGISGNEQADRLAKQALGLDNFSINVMFEALKLNKQIDVFVANLWQAESDKCKTGRFNKVLNQRCNTSVQYESTCRAKEVKITRLRLGKCRLNKYLHDIGKHADGLCDSCGVPETIEHYLLYCNNNNLKEVIKTICNKENVPYCIKDVLSTDCVVDAFYSCIKRVICTATSMFYICY